MRMLLLACAGVLTFSTDASACRALWEYPQTMAQVAELNMTPVDKEAYKQKLEAGFALHERGRAAQDIDLMKEAVKLLDDIKIDIAK